MPDETSHSDKPETGTEQDSAGGVMRRWVIVRHATIWHPPTDVYEFNDRLVVVVEIAGMRDSDFNVVLQGQRLIISGVRPRTTPPDSAYHQLEIPYGEFRTEVSLPWSVSRENVTASYRDGFLRIEMPHAPAQKIHVVNIKTEETDQVSPDSDTPTQEE
jgi:HSP20 family protein